MQFEESTRVPLIVRLPDGPNAGRVATGLGELVDLYPTLVDRSGLPDPEHALEGTSFGPPLDDPDRRWKSAAFSESRSAFTAGRCAKSTTATRSGRRFPERAGRFSGSSTTSKRTPSSTSDLAASGSHEAVVADLSRRLAARWQSALP